MNRHGVRMLFVLFAAASLQPAASSGLSADHRPSVAGFVGDPLGEPMPGVTITATEAYSRAETETSSGRDGSYRFEGLPDGIYRVDFYLPGFDLFRINNVRVTQGANVEANATMKLVGICECLGANVPPLRERTGLVTDQSGRPLARARLEISAPWGSDKTVAGPDGRFTFEAPVKGRWRLTVWDGGFNSAARDVSGKPEAPLVVTLRRAGSPGPQTSEWFPNGCRCPRPFLKSER